MPDSQALSSDLRRIRRELREDNWRGTATKATKATKAKATKATKATKAKKRAKYSVRAPKPSSKSNHSLINGVKVHVSRGPAQEGYNCLKGRIAKDKIRSNRVNRQHERDISDQIKISKNPRIRAMRYRARRRIARQAALV